MSISSRWHWQQKWSMTTGKFMEDILQTIMYPSIQVGSLLKESSHTKVGGWLYVICTRTYRRLNARVRYVANLYFWENAKRKKKQILIKLFKNKILSYKLEIWYIDVTLCVILCSIILILLNSLLMAILTNILLLHYGYWMTNWVILHFS